MKCNNNNKNASRGKEGVDEKQTSPEWFCNKYTAFSEDVKTSTFYSPDQRGEAGKDIGIDQQQGMQNWKHSFFQAKKLEEKK